ncbi:DEAD/DEAH box helicase family protein [Sandaracinobacter sp. RS1-74]|uniref:DEAD/DEAH box helicase n=1 Tax=Sandaracinobacteroides sayramensis TaxID=2913411 RepID=UPI001EDA6640|nr:DEAD/DEAH box helicase family protein [Sandaracinobacteroides sayramensis]MCG2840773.1 DEAD/DEAH box helicase family protein [Sandaracinobacteroides sayramensis]
MSNLRQVNAIAGRLSLRAPQRRSLEILDRVTEIVRPTKTADLAAALDIIKSEFPGVTNFERDFPSLCFALATGVGKTRLMGAFIAYLKLAHGINNFFVLAPNLTIYNKLIADFTANTPKYVFKGISEFAISPPVLTTGETYERQIASGGQLFPTTINIFNIAKISSEVRGGRSPRIRSFREEIGESYFDHLASLPDLVLLMDESHRYRATAGMRAINELKPVLGLELTATPFVESARGPVPFSNVIFDYPLARAMEDGFVKEPAVVTRRDFNPAGKSPDAIQMMKLEDGVRLHESVKVDLETYARENGERIVKPFVLVIARDTTHAAELMSLIQSDAFFEARYADKVIQVDSSVKEEETVEKLLTVEQNDNPVEIVIHVNMLKEGWDVTNLYTIIPLRAANARTLIEQSIGRGLRLPYGKRTGVTAVDRLNIVAHDRFQEIVDEANNPNSPIRLKQLVLDEADLTRKTVTVVSAPTILGSLGLQTAQSVDGAASVGPAPTPAFTDPDEMRVARLAYDAFRKLAREPDKVPSVSYLSRPEVQEQIVREVRSQYQPAQMELEGVAKPAPDMAAVIAATAKLMADRTIDIPRITVMPKGEVKAGFKPFTLDLSGMRYPAPSEELWAKHLRTDQVDVIGLSQGNLLERRLEDYVVSGLIDFPDIAYDEHADMLYELAGQVVRHLLTYLSEKDAGQVLALHQREIARAVHAQMQDHFWKDDTVEYHHEVRQGFTELKESAYTALREAPLDYRVPPADKSNMARYLFGGFSKCLSTVTKFHSDSERKLAVILERESLKWLRPAKGQFQMFYRSGNDHLEYQPDFVAEMADRILMLEPKMATQMQDGDVLAKRDVAIQWCAWASEHARSYGGKPWQYVLIPHDAIAENITVDFLLKQFG